ncbi:MAG: hypothetical protein ACTHMA_18145 [Thermomicrobiales bacterium]
MVKMTQSQIFDLCQRHLFNADGAAIMAAIAMAESGGDTLSSCIDCVPGVHENSQGLFQINLLAHPDVTANCAWEPNCAAAAAYNISKNGTDFTPWSTYNSGAYKQFYVPPDQITGQGGQAVTPNPAQNAINQLGSVTDKITQGATSLQPADFQRAAIAGGLIVIALAFIFIGAFGLVEKGKIAVAKQVIPLATKAGA